MRRIQMVVPTVQSLLHQAAFGTGESVVNCRIILGVWAQRCRRQLRRVEVDVETGVVTCIVTLVDYLGVGDAGTVVNPRSVVAQINGGCWASRTRSARRSSTTRTTASRCRAGSTTTRHRRFSTCR